MSERHHGVDPHPRLTPSRIPRACLQTTAGSPKAFATNPPPSSPERLSYDKVCVTKYNSGLNLSKNPFLASPHASGPSSERQNTALTPSTPVAASLSKTLQCPSRKPVRASVSGTAPGGFSKPLLSLVSYERPDENQPLALSSLRQRSRSAIVMAANLDQSLNDELAQNSSEASSEELGVMIDDMLSDLANKFNAVTSEITAKMDDMSRRIDNLEASMQSQQEGHDTTRNSA